MKAVTEGQRKYRLGRIYLIGGFVLVLLAVLSGLPTIIAAVAAALASLAGGLFTIIWGNAQEHRAKNGKP